MKTCEGCQSKFRFCVSGDVGLRSTNGGILSATTFWSCPICSHINVLVGLVWYEPVELTGPTSGRVSLLGVDMAALREKLKEWTESTRERKETTHDFIN